VSQLVEAGLTTVVGLLGTDTVTRSLPALLAKLKGLERDGVSTYMWTGGYRYPVHTLTGDIQTDMVLIDKVLGVGELAISDHRSNWPNYDEFVRVVSDLRVSGLLAGKAGLLHMHMGSAVNGLDLAWRVIKETTIPITHFYPTHMTDRGPALIADAKKWILAGGFVDFTADEANYTVTVDTLHQFRTDGVDLRRISVSSDAYGSMPEFDSAGRLIRYGVGHPDVTIKTIQTLVLQKGWPLEQALMFSTINPATFTGLANKGTLASGQDGDVLVLHPQNLKPQYVFARGQVMKTPLWTKHGMFDGYII